MTIAATLRSLEMHKSPWILRTVIWDVVNPILLLIGPSQDNGGLMPQLLDSSLLLSLKTVVQHRFIVFAAFV